LTTTVRNFRQTARIALDDIRLQNALDGATGRFRKERDQALQELPDAEALRDHFKVVRDATLADLGAHLREFESNALKAGAHVHWASDAAAAREVILAIARRNGVRKIVKSKSMAAEEIELNAALEGAGFEVIETDLGERIVQLAGEPPSHIIAPAIHKTKEQVAELFQAESGEPAPAEIQALTEIARRRLRQVFLQADLGISGGNLAVAETGSLVLVSNEGNARMVTSLPRIHIALIGIEKIAPTWDAAAVWLSLLARSATGQPLSIYTSILTGPRRPDDVDGPEEVHIVLLDNGRSRLVGTKFEEALQCIRCGACLNACPVYREAGGHAYASPYSGPIGAVISPLLFGLKEYEALPHASTLCGACLEVCPVRIDLPRMLIALRQASVSVGLPSGNEVRAFRSAAWILAKPARLKWVRWLLRVLQTPFKRGSRVLILGFNLPALAATPFRNWQRKHGRR